MFDSVNDTEDLLQQVRENLTQEYLHVNPLLHYSTTSSPRSFYFKTVPSLSDAKSKIFEEKGEMLI